MSELDLTDRASFATWTRVTIRYGDLDPNGHVNNVALTSYLEDGRVRFREIRFARLGRELLAGFVLARYEVEYHAPLDYPGTVDVGTAVLRMGRTSYTLGQGVFLDARCIASAKVVTVHVPPDAGKPTPVPDSVREALERAGDTPA